MDPKMNEDLNKEKAVYYGQAVKQMLRALIKKTPREILIEVLTCEKIIKRDWEQKGVKFKQYEKS